MIELTDSLFSFTNLLQPVCTFLADAAPALADGAAALVDGAVVDGAKDAAAANETVSYSFDDLFSLSGLFTLGMLILLQVVLGFDNLLYISIESKRVAEDRQSFVRKTGIGLAIAFRIVLLFVVVNLIAGLKDSFWDIDNKFISTRVNGHSLIVLGGGAFILWTALKEIYHLLAVSDIDQEGKGAKTNSVGKAVTMIVIMNLVFSFDSILSALALTKNFWTMAAAIVVSGVLMIWLADRVAEFLKKNRMYEVLGLFVLFIVGVMLVSEGGHIAHLKLFGHAIEPMAKSTFYFVLVVLIIVDVVQAKFQKNLLAQQESGRNDQAAG